MSDVEKKEIEEQEEEGVVEYPEGLEEDAESTEGDVSEPADKETKEEGGKKEAPKETPRFKLETPEPEKESDDNGFTEIVHNGQVHRITKDKLIELAQKGFDYDFKVGPHGKIVQMIDSDPEIAKIVSDHWEKKLSGDKEEKPSFKVKEIDDYDSETEWLQDNIQNAIEFGKSQSAPVVQQPARNTAVADALKMRDPEYCDKVISAMPNYASQLSVTDYQRIDSDMGALCQFYDFVKTQELAKTAAPTKVGTPGFRVRSGGGEAPKVAGKKSVAWNLSKDDFQKELNKIKGY